MKAKTRWSALFLGPPVAVYAAAVVFPTVLALQLSFTDASLGGDTWNWVGFDNFREALSDRHVLRSIRITLVWTLLGTLIPPAAGLAMAMTLRGHSRVAGLMKSALFVPLAISLVVVGQIWIWIYEPADGLLNQVLALVGIEGPAWLASRSLALAAVFVAWAWQQAVLAMVLYLAGLTTIPSELTEAAQVDGATPPQVFRMVTVPLLRPVTTVVLSLIAINSLRNFDLVYAMTRGGPVRETETMPLLVWRILFRQFEQGMASAVSIMLFAITLAVVGSLTWWGRRRSHVV